MSYDLRNSSVFNAWLKVCSDGNDVIAAGSMFPTLAAETGKARSPMVLCNDHADHVWSCRDLDLWSSRSDQFVFVPTTLCQSCKSGEIPTSSL